jgi:hypothetical protein
VEKENLDPQQSIELIEQMINKAKGSYHDSGIGALLWGTVVSICALVTWSEIHYKYELPFDIWLLTFIAVAPQIFISVRERKKRKAQRYEDLAMAYIWSVFGFSIFLLILININLVQQLHPLLEDYNKNHVGKGFYYYNYSSAMFLMLYGIPTIITGGITKFKPMLWGGLFCWVCCIAAIYTNIETDMLLTAAAAIVAWLIPGIILRKRYLNNEGCNV